MPGVVLVVEDDLAYAREVIAPAFSGFEVLFAPTNAAVRRILASRPPLAAATIDLGLPDGSGFESLEAIRCGGYPWIPVQVLTVLRDEEHAAEASRLRAFFAYMGTKVDLRTFAADLRTVTGVDQSLREVVDARARRYELTPRQGEVLHLLVAHVPRIEVARELGITEDCVDKHVKGILAGAAGGQMAWLIRSIWDEVRRR